MSCRTTIKPILSGLPAPPVRPFGATGLAGAKLGWPGATSIGRCKSAEVRQLSTTSLTQVRLHISGDNTPPPSKKCRRNSLYSAEACGPPTAVRWRPRLPAIRAGVRGRSNSRFEATAVRRIGELYNVIALPAQRTKIL
jgi:hypothetical protein